MINEFVRLAFDVFLALTSLGEACGVRAEADDPQKRKKQVEFMSCVYTAWAFHNFMELNMVEMYGIIIH